MMNPDQFETLLRKMDIIIRLLASRQLKELKNQSEKILELSSCGFNPSEIAVFLNTTPNTVSVTLSKAKRKGIVEQEEKTNK